MRTALEFLGFLTVAAASHLVVLSQAPPGTEGAAGDGGAETVTLAASSTALSEMVTEWSRPIEAAQQIALPRPAPLPDVQPPLPRQAPMPPAPMQPSTPQIPSPPTARSDLPRVDTSVPPLRDAAVTASKRPQMRPETSSPSQPATRQVASGSGRKQAAGSGSAATPPAATPRKASNRALMAQWGGGVRAAVERRKRYPSGTANSGTVTLSISVSTRGVLAGVSVVRSSGDGRLDSAALTAVRRARFPAAPGGLTAGVHRFSLPITFSR